MSEIKGRGHTTFWKIRRRNQKVVFVVTARESLDYMEVNFKAIFWMFSSDDVFKRKSP